MPSMRSTGRPHRRIKADINVVPYIDVMLVLLVIFMVTAPLITPGVIDLPSVGHANNVPVSPLEVQISQNGDIALRQYEPGADAEPIARSALASQALARVTPDTPVVIAADAKAPYESVVKVMDELRSHGMTRLGLLVDQRTASGQAAAIQQPAQTSPDHPGAAPLPSLSPSGRPAATPLPSLSPANRPTATPLPSPNASDHSAAPLQPSPPPSGSSAASPQPPPNPSSHSDATPSSSPP